MKTFILIMFCLLIGFLAGRYLNSTIYNRGYEAGFAKGLDTAGVELDKLIDSAKVMITELEAMQVESFPNHSEIKP